jgi:GWxTD domain-containing protein
MKVALLTACLILSLPCFAAEPAWIKQLDPILSRQERQRLSSLQSDTERAHFAESLWQSKRITAEEYYRRLAYIDETFGSGKSLSGFHTDRGRVYLSLGAPQKITHLVSSRVFFPIEIWHYAVMPDRGVNSALQLLFYQPNGAGDYHLYSPAIDTIRVLLNPQGGTRGVFRVNDMITPGDIRTKLTVAPAEDEVIEAATGVARGITGSGNEELIGFVTSPATALSAGSRPKVTSRISVARSRPVVRTFESWDSEGVPVLDFSIEATCSKRIAVRLSQGAEPVEVTATDFHFGEPKSIEYRHRFHLLPGKYTLSLDIDGSETATALETHARQPAGELLIGTVESAAKPVPFRFDSLVFAPSISGAAVIVQLDRPQLLRWRLTRGQAVVWTAQTRAEDTLPGGFLVKQFEPGTLPAGDYTLEVSGPGLDRSVPVQIGETNPSRISTIVSYNANLSEEARSNGLGRQFLRRHEIRSARACFERAARAGSSDETRVNLARVKALEGDFDNSRQILQDVLTHSPENFEALATMGYIEAKLQDYAIAADFYRRALAIQQSPVISQAIAELRLK